MAASMVGADSAQTVTRLDGKPATLTGITVLEFGVERIKTIKIFTDPMKLGGSGRT